MTKVSKGPLISVIIPVYNVEKYLDRCLKSTVSQSYKNIEIILIDDGSTDNSGKICDEWAKKDERIKVYHQKNGGLSNARNSGISHSSADYICFVDSDDWIDDKYVATLYSGMKSGIDTSIVKHYICFPNHAVSTGHGINKTISSKECIRMLLLQDDIDVSAWAKLYRRSLFRDVKYPETKLFEDTFTTYKLLLKSAKIHINSIPLYHYIIRDNSIAHTSFREENYHLIEGTQRMCEDILSVYPDLEAECNVRKMHALLSTLRVFAISRKQPVETKTKLLSLIKKQSKLTNISMLPKRERIALKLLYCYPLFTLIMKAREKRNGTI